MMMNLIKPLLAIIVIAVACLLQNLVSAKKSRRIRQFPLVIMAVLLTVTGVTILTRNFQSIGNWFENVRFLKNSELLLVNLSLIICFFALKLLLCPIIVFICKKKDTLEQFSLAIYDYDEDFDEWFLKKQFRDFRGYALAIVCGMVFVSGIYLGLTWDQQPGGALWIPFFPCAAVVILNEIYGFINGQTKEEFQHSILGKEADSRRVSNYYKLREILERLLPEPLLLAYTGSEYVRKETTAEILKELKESENTEDQITAEYFELNGRYKTADIDCIQATIDMMHRRNTVFFDPFYRDLGMYITLPLIHTLLSGKNCVVLCGRKSTAEDIKQWLTGLICEYTHIKSLWKVDYLSDQEPDCEVGVLTFTQIYDKKIINTNRAFYNETDFVLVIEPSVMLNTSQVALSILSEEMSVNDEKPIYCICDRYADGLIDTMSHLIHDEITDVVAMPVPRCSYTAMAWDVDGDFSRQRLFNKQTKYLGGGTEIAAVAVKNQVPHVKWYSEKKAPVKDIKWIAGQYYSTICQYMNLPSQQKKLYEKIDFESTLWTAEKSKEQFVIVEDEFCNMFIMMRAYLSRGENQIFVNVLSENYLLRDYMRCNKQMFISNPNAIPSYVPDYAKTERNTIIKLILLMTIRPVKEEEVLKEFRLVGIETTDAYGTLLELLHKYTFADDTLFTVRSEKLSVDEYTTVSANIFSVAEIEFDKYFSESLKNAYYVLENEENEQGYIDAKLFSHVVQTILPGQFVTYDGKYYQAKYVAPKSGVVLRRASDLFDGREYYRQIRTYDFVFSASWEVVSAKTVMDIEFVVARTNFSVDTTGYLAMKDAHDLRTARLVDFSADPAVAAFKRNYRNKAILRVALPGTTDRICFTICLLLNEVIKSVFPDGWQYLAVVTTRPDDIGGMLNYTVYGATGDVENGYIYIVEDSDVDLGLLESVEKHFMKFMEIIADFLDWHFEKMREPAMKDPVPVRFQKAEEEEKKHRNLVVRTLDRIRKLFGGKKEKEINIESVEAVENKTEREEETSPSAVNDNKEAAPSQSVEEKVYELDAKLDTPKEGVDSKSVEREEKEDTKTVVESVTQQEGEPQETSETETGTETSSAELPSETENGGSGVEHVEEEMDEDPDSEHPANDTEPVSADTQGEEENAEALAETAPDEDPDSEHPANDAEPISADTQGEEENVETSTEPTNTDQATDEQIDQKEKEETAVQAEDIDNKKATDEGKKHSGTIPALCEGSGSEHISIKYNKKKRSKKKASSKKEPEKESPKIEGSDRPAEEAAEEKQEDATPDNEMKQDKADTAPESEPSLEEDEDSELVHIDGTDIFDGDGMPEDNDYLEMSFQEMGLSPLTKTRYQKECFLKFGYEEIDSRIRIDEVFKYLRVHGWANNALTQARKRDALARQLLDLDTSNHCDFCGIPLSGVSFERLNDGRVQCNDCSASAITSLDEFKALFYRCLEMMQDIFGIKYQVPINVRMTDARELAKGIGMIFKPSVDVASRTLGYAQKKSGQYSLIVENGSPRLASIDTIVHEMTHIWQYLNWNDKELRKIYNYGDPALTTKARDILYEGMAMWASIQYLYQTGEMSYAAQQEAIAEAQNDIYGVGFKLYREQYPLVKDAGIIKFTPFASFPPLDPENVRKVL